MRADDLDHKELLELDPDGGVIRFAGQRALLLDSVAMGLLRKYLVENFGLTAARTVLTQFGFAHGWRMAEAMQAAFTWDSDEEWRRAGTSVECHRDPWFLTIVPEKARKGLTMCPMRRLLEGHCRVYAGRVHGENRATNALTDSADRRTGASSGTE
jgi:hypothetical protein